MTTQRHRGLVKVVHNGMVEVAAFECVDGVLRVKTPFGNVSRHRAEADVVKQVEYLLEVALLTADSLRSDQESPY